MTVAEAGSERPGSALSGAAPPPRVVSTQMQVFRGLSNKVYLNYVLYCASFVIHFIYIAIFKILKDNLHIKESRDAQIKPSNTQKKR